MVYFVGPDLMRDLILNELKTFHVPSHHILCEVTGPPKDITQCLGWPKDKIAKKSVNVTLNYTAFGKRKTQLIEANCTEPLLNSIERAKIEGIKIQNACRAGVCALCRTRLRQGEIFVPNYVVIREYDKILGYIHPCVSYPISDLELELFIA